MGSTPRGSEDPRSMVATLDESQVTYRVLLEFITQVNGCYNDGATTLTNLFLIPDSVVVTQQTLTLLL